MSVAPAARSPSASPVRLAPRRNKHQTRPNSKGTGTRLRSEQLQTPPAAEHDGKRQLSH